MDRVEFMSEITNRLWQKNDYEPGFSLKLLNKDLRFAMELAEGHGIQLPISQALVDLYADAERAGLGDKDMSVLVKRIGEQTITFKPEGTYDK